MNCPHCNSDNYKLAGHLKDGSQKYYCKDCKRYYSAKTVIKDPLTVKCTYCNSEQIRKSGTLHGAQRYQCKSCGKKFVLHPKMKFQKFHLQTCPKCGFPRATKAGTDKGVQLYRCKKCNHKFKENQKFRQTSEAVQKEVKTLVSEGKPVKEVASMFNICEKTVRNIKKRIDIESIKHEILLGASRKEVAKNNCISIDKLNEIMQPFYEEEKITTAQRNMIIQYGVSCAVPVDYLASYVKCSENYCEKILKQYTIEKTKYELTEKDKRNDEYALLPFIQSERSVKEI